MTIADARQMPQMPRPQGEVLGRQTVYLDELLEENRQLREALATPSTPGPGFEAAAPPVQGLGDPIDQVSSEPASDRYHASRPGSAAPSNPSRAGHFSGSSTALDSPSGSAAPVNSAGDSVRNPLLEDRPWFFPLTPAIPILIGEATDAAFATRFRQILSGNGVNHLPRAQFAPDEHITSFFHADCPWPSPARARFLMKVSFNTAGKRYYLGRASVALNTLEQAIRSPALCDRMSACKLFAHFALGELYSSRATGPENLSPGIGYYSNATAMLRAISEQPNVDCIESLYSITINRRHSAYCIAGAAVRFAILLGLHLNVPEHQLPRELREHRVRLWWTVYILDRSWASLLGQPVSIQDEDIDVSLPSLLGFSGSAAEDFADPDYLIADIRVTKLSADITTSIYSRRMQTTSISCRVQQALRDLKNLVQQLPDHIRTAVDELPPHPAMRIVTLHLFLNQCLILATRPILLHVLRIIRDSSKLPESYQLSQITESAMALSEACIQCARRSHRILTDSWIGGFFPTFDYTYTRYVFSSGIILAISSLFPTSEAQSDSDDFEAAVQILKQLEEHGNYAAKEFTNHAEATKVCIRSAGKYQAQGSHVFLQADASSGRDPKDSTIDEEALVPTAANADWTTMGDVSLQEILSQPSLDFRFLEPSMVDDAFQTFFWPDGTGESHSNN